MTNYRDTLIEKGTKQGLENSPLFRHNLKNNVFISLLSVQYI